MKFDLVKEQLALILSDLTEQFNTMNEYKEGIHQIEVDIFMKNIQKLYEVSIKLKKANQILETPDILKDVVENTSREKVEEQPIKDALVEKAEETPATEKEEVAAVNERIEEKKEEKNLSISEDTKNERIPETPPSIKSSFDDILEESVVDLNLFSDVKISDEITDLNKKLAAARNTNSIAEKLQNGRIESLKSVIGINDKFYFINELFGGDAQKYENVIYTLNNFKKIDDAMQYFSTLKFRFNWDEESEAYVKLVNMLERKFRVSQL